MYANFNFPDWWQRKDKISVEQWGQFFSRGAFLLLCINDFIHWRRTCEGYFLNSLWPISYLGVFLGVIWTRDSQWQNSFAENTPKCLKEFQPNLSAQTQKFGIFEKKKLSVGVRSSYFIQYLWYISWKFRCVNTAKRKLVCQNLKCL